MTRIRSAFAPALLCVAFVAHAGDPVQPEAAPAAPAAPVAAPAVEAPVAPAAATVAPAATAPEAPSAPTEPARPEGRRLEGVNLSPGVAEIAKKEGEVKLTQDDRVKCEKYKPLGSNRWQYRCTTLAEDEASRSKNEREMRKMQTPPPSARGVGN